MTLDDYLKNAERGALLKLATAVGVSSPTVSQWRSGLKRPEARRCHDIERCTNGAVRRWELRPDDWHQLWPELIGTAGAPKVRSAA